MNAKARPWEGDAPIATWLHGGHGITTPEFSCVSELSLANHTCPNHTELGFSWLIDGFCMVFLTMSILSVSLSAVHN